jgi:Fuc2NAc and GlcNAc transferase
MTIGVAAMVGATAFALAWVLTALILMAARRFRVLDHPNSRSAHSVPTPTVGGIGIVLTVLCASMAYPFFYQGPSVFYVISVTSSLVAVISLIDDLGNVSTRNRIVVHLFAAIVIVYAGISALQERVDLSTVRVISVFLAGSIVIVWSTNLFNFMDGIDGMAASESIFVSFTGSVFLASCGATGWALILLVTAVSSAAFLVFNRPPARIFLGDVGSAFIGFILASVAFLSYLDGFLSPAFWMILTGLFLVDATYTLIVRLVTGQRWLKPHNLHVYQKLSRKYGSHSKATLLYASINIIWLLPMAWFAYWRPSFEWWILLVALAPLGVGGIKFLGGVANTELA